MSDIKISINDKEYKLKVTLGFWKNLSFPRLEIGSIASDFVRLNECIGLAIYYGSKKDKEWTLPIHAKNALEEDLDDIDSQEDIEALLEAIGQALTKFMPINKAKAASVEKDAKKK